MRLYVKYHMVKERQELLSVFLRPTIINEVKRMQQQHLLLSTLSSPAGSSAHSKTLTIVSGLKYRIHRICLRKDLL